MSYVITGTNSAEVLSLKRDSAVAAIKKAVELIGDSTRDVHITDPDAAFIVMRNFPNSMSPRGHNPSAVRWDRDRAVIGRFAGLLRHANSEAVSGNGTRLFRPRFVEIDPELRPMLHHRRRAKLICRGEDLPGGGTTPHVCYPGHAF